MRLLKRHTDEDVGDERTADQRAADERAADERTADQQTPDERTADERTADEQDGDTTMASRPAPPPPPAPGPAPDHAGPAVPDGRPMDAPDGPTTDRPDRPMADGTYTDETRPERRVDPATERVAPVDEGPVDEGPDRPERVETEDVLIRRWSWADAAVALIGAALALVGILAMTRTGVNTSWYSPVENVIDASHTQLLGAIETVAGVLLVVAALGRSRILATLIGLAMAVGGAYAAIETAEVARELAIEDWWAWTMAGIGVLVVLLALVPRRGRVERVVRSA